MKQLIISVAIIIIYSQFIIYQHDHNRYLRELLNLKYVADECSASASLYYDDENLRKGLKVYNIIESERSIKELLKKNLILDDSLKPINNNYWQDNIIYYSYYFDDSGMMKVYKNNVLQEQKVFTYNYLFTDPLTGYTKLITEPTVIVTINAGKSRYRLAYINNNRNSIRSSGYEYLN